MIIFVITVNKKARFPFAISAYGLQQLSNILLTANRERTARLEEQKLQFLL
jgi:hypothetical protein